MADSPFKPGTRVHDQSADDDSDLAIVVACPDLPAGEYEIGDTGQTVADYNPDCDPSTPVVSVAFQPALDASPLDWQPLLDTPTEFADHVAAHDIQTYTYPATRLNAVPNNDPLAAENETENATGDDNPDTHGDSDSQPTPVADPPPISDTPPTSPEGPPSPSPHPTSPSLTPTPVTPKMIEPDLTVQTDTALPADASPTSVTAWFDGLCEPTNPDGHGAYGVVVDVDGDTVYEAAAYLGDGGSDWTMTNNVAEYAAAIAALRYIAERSLLADTHLTLTGDSQLVIRQLTGQYAVNSRRLHPLWQAAHDLVRDLDADPQWVPREQNEHADRLSRTAYHKHVTQPARDARKQRAWEETIPIEHLDGTQYRVKNTYIVDLDDESCTCPDYEHRGQPCKHLYAVKDATADADNSADADP